MSQVWAIDYRQKTCYTFGMKSLLETNPYLRRADTRNEMTERTVRDSCIMEGIILPPERRFKKKHNHKSAR